MTTMPTPDIERVTQDLLAYCQREHWAGYDPYDALNSRLFRATPLFHSKICRIAFTQFMKRSPINFRPLVGVPKRRNPKGTALFISALIRLKHTGFFNDHNTILALLDDLIASRSPNQPDSCWGYPFDWQTRRDLVPKVSPNIICTTFAGHALLDAFETFDNEEYLTHAASASRFLREHLYEELDNGEACFNYTPIGPSRIHNANLLGAAYLARIASVTNEPGTQELVQRATTYSLRKQAPDGSWVYGEADTQQWIDNFHTGFNLCALQTIKNHTATDRLNDPLQRGMDFFVAHFFRPDGAPKYYHDRTYPIDIHSAAQSIVTLCALPRLVPNSMDLAHSVLDWTVANLRSSAGYFFFQKHACYTNRTPYIRWTQAWMLLAMAHLLASEAE